MTALVAIAICALTASPGIAAAKPPKKPPPTPAQAKHWVTTQLGNRQLTPRSIRCRIRGRASICRWQATQVIDSWTFHCGGDAERSKRRREFEACRLRATPLAPQLPAESLGGWQPAFGFNEDWIDQLSHMNLVTGVGANTSRIPFHWSTVEPEPNHYNWQGYDRVYAAMSARKIQPILTFDGAPCWARPKTSCTNNGLLYPPDRRHLRDWRQFIKEALRRYPAIAGVEVWNEPNLNGFWQPHPSPKRYVELLRTTSKTVNAIAPRVPVVFGGLVPQFGVATRGMDARVFQRRAYRLGAGRYVDAFGVHPYVFPSSDGNYKAWVRAQMAIPKGIAASFGYPATPLWVTEFGLSTYGTGALSPPDQASRLVDLYEILRAIPDVPVVILHRLIDLPPGGNDWQAGMGIASPSGAPKPAFCALAIARTGRCPFK